MKGFYIQIPEEAQPVTFEKAMDEYKEGAKVLVTLSDEEGVYAAHVFSMDWDNLELGSSDYFEYKANGNWFLI